MHSRAQRPAAEQEWGFPQQSSSVATEGEKQALQSQCLQLSIFFSTWSPQKSLHPPGFGGPLRLPGLAWAQCWVARP